MRGRNGSFSLAESPSRLMTVPSCGILISQDQANFHQRFCGLMDVTFLTDPDVFPVHSSLRKEENLIINMYKQPFSAADSFLTLLHPPLSPHLFNPLFFCYAHDRNLLTSHFLFLIYSYMESKKASCVFNIVMLILYP